MTHNLVWVVDPGTHPGAPGQRRFGEGFSSLHPLRRRGFSEEITPKWCIYRLAGGLRSNERVGSGLPVSRSNSSGVRAPGK